MTISSVFGIIPIEPLNRKDVFVAGIEHELEAVRVAKNFRVFTVKEDGSLRNHGYEFVSAPLPRKELVQELTELHKWLTYYEKEDPFSQRTSTHVHVNCLMLEEAEARNMVMLYALFEELFFSMVKPERRNNIHCVPLTETTLPGHYKKDIQTLIAKWSKYTALNLKRMPDLGTMEFRHYHGTNDVAALDQWLQVLENLYHLSQKVTIDAASLASKETILSWFDYIFAPAPRIMMLRPSLFNLIYNSLIDVKFSV